MSRFVFNVTTHSDCVVLLNIQCVEHVHDKCGDRNTIIEKVITI